jgi:UPF0271 protein
MKIDLNCDMGESFGRYKLGNDGAVMPFVTSANIACGLHAGDPLVMRSTIRLAKQCGVAIGAHPGWPDLQGFGRRDMAFAADEVEAFVLYQIGALAALARTEGVPLTHVKPHGALYNQAAKDAVLAAAIARAVKAWDDELILVGLAGSAMITAGLAKDLRVASEAFPDRRYNADGTLVSRTEASAVLVSTEEVAANAVRLAREGIDIGGRRVQVDTLCLHGDNPSAVDNARLVHEALEKAGIQVRAI